MEVLVDGRPTFEWKVSTARKGYVTPTGSYKPTRLEEMWYSRKYDNSPMPHSVFFHGGYAVHATNAIKRLGTPASHGCIRLHPNDAADFYQLVAGVRTLQHQHRDHRVVRRASGPLRQAPLPQSPSLDGPPLRRRSSCFQITQRDLAVVPFPLWNQMLEPLTGYAVSAVPLCKQQHFKSMWPRHPSEGGNDARAKDERG